jgi:hypothetical protein
LFVDLGLVGAHISGERRHQTWGPLFLEVPRGGEHREGEKEREEEREGQR